LVPNYNVMQFIKTEIRGFTGIITLDNDEKHNSLNLRMLKEMEESLDDFAEQKIRTVIIRSNAGAKVWCAGLRIDELPKPGTDPVPFRYPLEDTLNKIENFPGAVIAMIEGSVWGGGCELAFSCDILIGSPKSTFAITPAKLNAPYNPVQVQRVLSLVETNIAKELFFTAAPIKAERALELGILNHMTVETDLETVTMKMAEDINGNAPQSITLLKMEINAIRGNAVRDLQLLEDINKMIEKLYYSKDFEEGKKAFLEKRRPDFSGE